MAIGLTEMKSRRKGNRGLPLRRGFTMIEFLAIMLIVGGAVMGMGIGAGIARTHGLAPAGGYVAGAVLGGMAVVFSYCLLTLPSRIRPHRPQHGDRPRRRLRCPSAQNLAVVSTAEQTVIAARCTTNTAMSAGAMVFGGMISAEVGGILSTRRIWSLPIPRRERRSFSAGFLSFRRASRSRMLRV